MTKLSSKMHLFIVISCIIIAAGMAVGTALHFVQGKFFNYGGEFADYKAISVNYLSAERNDEEIYKLCEGAMDGLTPVDVSLAETSTGVEVLYKFSPNAEEAALKKAVEAINAELSKVSDLSVATYHTAKTEVGGDKVVIFASVAVASALVAQCIYFVFRFGSSAALSALVANVHNVGLFTALVALTRIPAGINIVAFAASAVVLLTMICTGVLFDRARKNFAAEENAKLSVNEIADASAAECNKANTVTACALIILIALLAIANLIARFALPVIAVYGVALLAIVSCYYGIALFTPAVYAGMKKAGNRMLTAIKSDKKA